MPPYFISGIWTETGLLSMLHTMLRGEAVKPGLDWTGFWTGFWTQLYYVIGQCKHGVTVHV